MNVWWNGDWEQPTLIPPLTRQERLQFPGPTEGILTLGRGHDVTVMVEKQGLCGPLLHKKHREAGCGESSWNARIGDVVTPQEWGVGPRASNTKAGHQNLEKLFSVF